MTNHGRPIEFRLGVSLLSRSYTLWVLGIVLGIPMLLLLGAGLIAAAVNGDSQNFSEALASAWKAMDKDNSLAWKLWLMAALVPVGVLGLKMQRSCYLRLTGSGMEGYVPKWIGLVPFGLSTGHWKAPWESVRSIRLVPGKHPGMPALKLRGYQLVIETSRGQRRLSPFFWVLPDGPDHRLTMRDTFPSSRFDAAKVIERAPLVQALRARGIEFSLEPIVSEEKPADFDLAKHPGMVAQLALLFVAGLYALLDTFFIGSFMALEPLPAGPFVIATVAGAAIAFVLGKGAPVRERSVVSVLMVAALTAAAYPGLLRYNAITSELQEVSYRAVGAGQFESTVSGFPNLDLRKLNVPEYWSEYPEGSEHEFNLMRGAGGFYQVDLGPLYARTREFYSR